MYVHSPSCDRAISPFHVQATLFFGLFVTAMGTAGEHSLVAVRQLAELWKAFVASASASMQHAVLTFLFPEGPDGEVAGMKEL